MPSLKRIVALYVDKVGKQWVVRDDEGNLWSLPSSEFPWNDRRPFQPTDEIILEQVPGHYKYMLDLPL